VCRVSSILESKLKEFSWRKKRLSRTYTIPAEILELDNPIIFYPGAGRDISLAEKLAGSHARVIYQDIIYGHEVMLIDKAYNEYIGEKSVTEEFLESIQSQGAEVIHGALTADSLDETADLVLLKGVFGFLFQNDFSEMILANCKEGTFITGYRFDLDVMCLLYDGLERVDSQFIRVHDGYSHSELYEHLTRFPELSFWALKGSFRTFNSYKIGKQKFEKRGRALVEKELENAEPDELQMYFDALPKNTYPKYLRDFLKDRRAL